jgi:peptidyl-prolyl cis-trans isomerase C
MPIVINGTELLDADVARELPQHQDAINPTQSAVTALVLRRVMLDEGARLGCTADTDEATIDALLADQVKLTVPTEDACRRHYEQHHDKFLVGRMAEVDHILFQVTPNVDLDALHAKADAVLTELIASPERFAERARELSNCPSGGVGGSLGQITMGETVPEFESAVFGHEANRIVPRLVETRFGLHIIRIGRRDEGRLLPYEQVAGPIANALAAMHRDTVWRQYLRMLAGRASIQGVELPGLDEPLVQ